jgi:hypothetical protein
MQLHSSELRDYLQAYVGETLPDTVWDRLNIGDDLELDHDTVKALRHTAAELLDEYYDGLTAEEDRVLDERDSQLDRMIPARREMSRSESWKQRRYYRHSLKRNLPVRAKRGHRRFRMRRLSRSLHYVN